MESQWASSTGNYRTPTVPPFYRIPLQSVIRDEEDVHWSINQLVHAATIVAVTNALCAMVRKRVTVDAHYDSFQSILNSLLLTSAHHSELDVCLVY